jgi:hypothetical protein
MLGNGNTTGPRRMTQRIIGLLLTFAASASLMLFGAPCANAWAYASGGGPVLHRSRYLQVDPQQCPREDTCGIGPSPLGVGPGPQRRLRQ